MINFEVVTVKCVSIDGVVYTVANIYNNINNRKNIRKHDFDLVYQKLEGTKILCGDFNGSSFCRNQMVVKIGQNRIFPILSMIHQI